MKKTNKKGFTLAELLVVVAIIAVMVAIAIPIFTAQLEKAKEATDAANIRSAYAELISENLSEGKTDPKVVNMTQGKEGWDSDVNLPENLTETNTPIANGTATITLTADKDGNDVATVTYAAKTGN